MTVRLGAIDVGTNTVLLTIATSDGRKLVPLVERATITRLGQGVDERGELHPDARTRTLACLEDYRALCDAHGVSRLSAVGTSALRDARDGSDFREKAREILGVELEIIPGEREAGLTFRGGLSGLELTDEHSSALDVEGDAPDANSRPLFVFDIGGGSTELIWGQLASGPDGAHHAHLTRATSLNLGSVRLFERFRMADPPAAHELDALVAFIDAELARIEPWSTAPLRAPLVVGIAGTVTTLVALLVGDSRLPGDSKLPHVANTSNARDESRAEVSSGPGPAYASRSKEPSSRSITPSSAAVTTNARAPSLDATHDARDDSHAHDSSLLLDDSHARDSSLLLDDSHARDSTSLVRNSQARDAMARDSASATPPRDSFHAAPEKAPFLAASADVTPPVPSRVEHDSRSDARDTLDVHSSPSTSSPSITPAPAANSITTTRSAFVNATGASVHGLSATLDELRALTVRLARLSTPERCQLPGLDPGRADVIVIGATLCVRLLEWIGADSVVASDRGVRWGLLEEAQESIDSRQTSD